MASIVDRFTDPNFLYSMATEELSQMIGRLEKAERQFCEIWGNNEDPLVKRVREAVREVIRADSWEPAGIANKELRVALVEPCSVRKDIKKMALELQRTANRAEQCLVTMSALQVQKGHSH